MIENSYLLVGSNSGKIVLKAPSVALVSRAFWTAALAVEGSNVVVAVILRGTFEMPAPAKGGIT